MPANGASRKPGPLSSDDAARIGGQGLAASDDDLDGAPTIRITAPAKKVSATTATASKATAGKTTASKTTARGTQAAKTTARPNSAKPAAKKGGASSSTRRTQPTSQRGTSRPGSTRKPGRSIVAKQQKPWGLIITSVVVFVFAVGVIAFAVTRHAAVKTDAGNRWDLPEIAAAKVIKGVVFKPELNHEHVTKAVTYDSTPPTGGNHSAVYADCSGTVYPNAIANENAVHDLEHGAVWITYRPGLPSAQVATLAALVTGHDHTLMSPYPNLKSAASLQAWGYQLPVNSVTDPRIKAFISALRGNTQSTPELNAAGNGPNSCALPQFKKSPSTFGHPIFTLT